MRVAAALSLARAGGADEAGDARSGGDLGLKLNRAPQKRRLPGAAGGVE